jgi:hypothetical protein
MEGAFQKESGFALISRGKLGWISEKSGWGFWDRSFNYPVDYVYKYRVCVLFLALSDNYTEVREISVMYPWMLNIEHPVCYRIVAHGLYRTTDS